MGKKQNAFYAQSGGVTAVINSSAAAVIETVRENSDVIGTLFAGQNGIIGALTEDLIDTSALSEKEIEALHYTPSGAFGSCRYKLKSLEENKREYERLIEVFKAHNIGYFFYNGGGDSADTCLKVSQISEAMGYPIKAIHIPKTVDRAESEDLYLVDEIPMSKVDRINFLKKESRELNVEPAVKKRDKQIFYFAVNIGGVLKPYSWTGGEMEVGVTLPLSRKWDISIGAAYGRNVRAMKSVAAGYVTQFSTPVSNSLDPVVVVNGSVLPNFERETGFPYTVNPNLLNRLIIFH